MKRRKRAPGVELIPLRLAAASLVIEGFGVERSDVPGAEYLASLDRAAADIARRVGGVYSKRGRNLVRLAPRDLRSGILEDGGNLLRCGQIVHRRMVVQRAAAREAIRAWIATREPAEAL
jgi:hypothetical protein